MKLVIRSCEPSYGRMPCFECGARPDFAEGIGIFRSTESLDPVCSRCASEADPVLAAVYSLWLAHRAVMRDDDDTRRRWR